MSKTGTKIIPPPTSISLAKSPEAKPVIINNNQRNSLIVIVIVIEMEKVTYWPIASLFIRAPSFGFLKPLHRATQFLRLGRARIIHDTNYWPPLCPLVPLFVLEHQLPFSVLQKLIR